MTMEHLRRRAAAEPAASAGPVGARADGSRRRAVGGGYEEQARALAPSASAEALAAVPLRRETGPPGLVDSALGGNSAANNAAGVIDTVGDAGRRLPAGVAAGADAMGTATGYVSLAADLVDIANDGLNFENGVSFALDLAGQVATVPQVKAVLTGWQVGYQLGTWLDEMFHISDWFGSLAARGDAGGHLAQLQAAERLAAQGDAQCARLVALYRQRAGYENTGARRVNEDPVNQAIYGGNVAHGVDPERLREIGRGAQISERARELQASRGLDAYVATSVAASQLPDDDALAARIDEEVDLLERRIQEARELQRGVASLPPAPAPGGTRDGRTEAGRGRHPGPQA